MITELPVGYQIEKDGFIFTLTTNAIWVENLDGQLVSYIRVLDSNGHRIVRSEEQFQSEIDWWLKENL
jgi:hypothetical protein